MLFIQKHSDELRRVGEERRWGGIRDKGRDERVSCFRRVSKEKKGGGGGTDVVRAQPFTTRTNIYTEPSNEKSIDQQTL